MKKFYNNYWLVRHKLTRFIKDDLFIIAYINKQATNILYWRMFMISKEQLEICERKLIERQGELIKRLRNHLDVNLTLTEAASELSSFDLNHPADTATTLYDRTQELSLKNSAESELEKINKALYAIEEGTYGICTICGTAIEYERLLAMPAADKCIEHAEMDEQDYDWDDL